MIDRATAVLKPHTVRGRLLGDVGAALVSTSGRVYTGVSIDTPGWGLCAERSAIAAMVTEGEYCVEQIVAVWRDPETTLLHVLPPCGICREFLHAVHASNLQCDIILGLDTRVRLEELLPRTAWPGPLEAR